MCDLPDREFKPATIKLLIEAEKCMNCSQEIEITRVPNRNLGTEEYYK